MVISFVEEASSFLKELRAIERKWQQRWEKARIFEANPDTSKPKFFITVPYPYTSGPLHIGHGRTYTIGDIYARFKRMQGFNVLWPMAFHITGTPIASISSRIARGERETITLYRNYIQLYIRDKEKIGKILESFTKPENVANFFASVISQDFKSLGYSIDWRRKFTTGDPEYNSFIRWQFLRLRDKGYLAQGAYPVLYCPNDGNAVGEDDIRGGDEFRPEIVEFVGIKFQMGNVFLVASTLRPETLFGVTNIWVNPEAKYVLSLVNNEHWIISRKAAEKLRYQGYNIRILKEFKGYELVGKRCRSPINDKELLILPAFFVDDDSATGIVYSVPAHAPFDYVALRDLEENPALCKKYNLDSEVIRNIRPISIIHVEGYGDFPAIEIVERMKIKSQNDIKKLEEATKEIYKIEFYHGIMKENCGKFAKTPVMEAKEKVKEWLFSRRYAAKIYEVNPRPIYCRCGAKILVAIMKDQWFINYNAPGWKEFAFKALNSMEIYPQRYRKLFEDTFAWLALRPCARKRGLGTRLPFDERWIIESLSDSTIYMAFYTIVHHIRRYKISAKALIPEVFDYIFLGKGDPSKLSKMTGIERKILELMRSEFVYWYPVDLRHTAIGHITNHLSFFIFHHVALFPPKFWPRRITLNEYVIREGAKMSKSKGNVLPLVEIPRKYSADLYRLYITYAADLSSIVDWREAQVLSVLGRLKDFWIIANEIIKRGPGSKPSKLSLPTKWWLSVVNSIIEMVTKDLEHYRYRDYVQKSFFDMLNALERYRRLASKVPDDERAWAEYHVLKQWIKLLSPVIPHITEELWERMGEKTFLSTESWPKAEYRHIDKELELAVESIERTIADVKEIIRVIKGITPSKVYLYVGPEPWKYKVCKMVASLEGLRINEIIRKVIEVPEIRRHGREAVKLIKMIVEGKAPRLVPSRDVEIQAFRELADYIEREVGLKVYIEDALKPSYDPQGRARLSLPGRPGIYVE